MPERMKRMMFDLQQEVKKDSFNLTRDDHDAICTKIEELKKFIQERYEQHKRNV